MDNSYGPLVSVLTAPDCIFLFLKFLRVGRIAGASRHPRLETPWDQNLNSHLLPLFISYRSGGEKSIKNQVNSSSLITSVILMTTLFYKTLILQGEIWCWSILGLKRFNEQWQLNMQSYFIYLYSNTVLTLAPKAIARPALCGAKNFLKMACQPREKWNSMSSWKSMHRLGTSSL